MCFTCEKYDYHSTMSRKEGLLFSLITNYLFIFFNNGDSVVIRNVHLIQELVVVEIFHTEVCAFSNIISRRVVHPTNLIIN